MEWPASAAILKLIASFEAGQLDFDDLMLQLGSVVGTEITQDRAPEVAVKAWNSLDDVYAIARSQVTSGSTKLELNHEVRLEFERFRRTVENAVIH